MQLVIIAGGKGTRLGLKSIPKPMIKIGGIPLLQHQIKLAQRFGLENVIIISSHKANATINYFKDGKRFDTKITHIVEETPLGTAGCLKVAEDLLENRFMVFYGDLLINFDLDCFIKQDVIHECDATLVVHPNDHPYDSDLVQTDKQDRITAFFPKPHIKGVFYQNLANAGVYILSKKVLRYIPNDKKTDLGKDIFPQMLQCNCSLIGYRTTEFIKDIGTPKRLSQIRKEFESGKVKRSSRENKQKAIFLDRDGVINKEIGGVTNTRDFELIPGTIEAIKLINNSEFLCIIVTNQPGIAKGFITEDSFFEISRKMETLLGEQGAFIDDLFYCPHHPDQGYPNERVELKINCTCRKPNIGMIERAAIKYNINLEESHMIGDSFRDIQCAKNANLKTAGVLTGHGCEDCVPDYIFPNLLEAVKFILKII